MAELGEIVSIMGSVVGIRSGTEEPKSIVLDTLGEGLEIRRYPELAAVEVSMATTDRDRFRNEAFGKLFRYISGANSGSAKIAMTAPVEQQGTSIAMTAPVETRGEGGRMTMRFFLPAGYTAETAPRPTDAMVKVVRVPPRDLAVYRFTGSTSQEAIAEAGKTLAQGVARSRWQPAGPLFTLLYDPPFTVPFLRRNEVAMAVTRTAP